jgi:hypothetical protein
VAASTISSAGWRWAATYKIAAARTGAVQPRGEGNSYELLGRHRFRDLYSAVDSLHLVEASPNGGLPGSRL